MRMSNDNQGVILALSPHQQNFWFVSHKQRKQVAERFFIEKHIWRARLWTQRAQNHLLLTKSTKLDFVAVAVKICAGGNKNPLLLTPCSTISELSSKVDLIHELHDLWTSMIFDPWGKLDSSWFVDPCFLIRDPRWSVIRVIRAIRDPWSVFDSWSVIRWFAAQKFPHFVFKLPHFVLNWSKTPTFSNPLRN